MNILKQCKYCGSQDLVLENKSKLDLMSAPQVSLKCSNCGKWLKWCAKDERQYYNKSGDSNSKYEIKIEELQKQIFNKEKEIAKIKDSCNYYMKRVNDLVVKHNQVAIAKLKKVKEKFGYIYNSQLMVSSKSLCDYIDNQIKQLKKIKGGEDESNND